MNNFQIIGASTGAILIAIWLFWGYRFFLRKQASKFDESYRIYKSSTQSYGKTNQKKQPAFDYVAFKNDLCYATFQPIPFFIAKCKIIEKRDDFLHLEYEGIQHEITIQKKEQI